MANIYNPIINENACGKEGDGIACTKHKELQTKQYMGETMAKAGGAGWKISSGSTGIYANGCASSQ